LTWSHREVGADISESEIPADAVSGVGVVSSTYERVQNKRTRTQVLSGWAVRKPKRLLTRGRYHNQQEQKRLKGDEYSFWKVR